MTFEEFWKENYEKGFGTSEPYYSIGSYAFEKKGRKTATAFILTIQR